MRCERHGASRRYFLNEEPAASALPLTEIQESTHVAVNHKNVGWALPTAINGGMVGDAHPA
jgi:hypothetical protein